MNPPKCRWITERGDGSYLIEVGSATVSARSAAEALEVIDEHWANLDEEHERRRRLAASVTRSGRRARLLGEAADRVLSTLSRRPTFPRQLPTVTGFHVYVAYDRDDVVQYVGMTSNIYSRLGNHSIKSPWWAMSSRIVLHRAANERAARRLERSMIQSLRPVFNIAA